MNRTETGSKPSRTGTAHEPFKIRFRFGSHEPEPSNRRFRPETRIDPARPGVRSTERDRKLENFPLLLFVSSFDAMQCCSLISALGPGEASLFFLLFFIFGLGVGNRIRPGLSWSTRLTL